MSTTDTQSDSDGIQAPSAEIPDGDRQYNFDSAASGTSADPDADAANLDIILQPARIAKALACLVLTIVVIGTVARIVTYQVASDPEANLAKFMHRFDLGHEPSIPNWYSSLALIGCAGLLLLIATAKKRTRAPYTFHWYALASLFLLLALDEAVMIHEMADTPMHNLLDAGGVLYYTWIIPGAAFVMLVGLFFLRFLLHLERRTRLLIILSGVIFLSGALGLEMVEGIITENFGVASIQFTVAQSLEEGLEMMGIVLFAYALLDYLGRHVGPVVLRVGNAATTGTRLAKNQPSTELPEGQAVLRRLPR